MPTTDHGFVYPDTSYTASFVTAMAALTTSIETYADSTDLTTIATFASFSERTAALPAPTTGRLSRLSTERFIRRYDGTSWLPYGSAQYPIVPAASGTGVTVSTNGTITMTACPTLTVTCFSSDWNDYLIINDFTSKSAGGDMNMTLTSSGTAVTTNYRGNTIQTFGTTVSGLTDSTSSFRAEIGAAATRSVGRIELSSPFLASPTAMQARFGAPAATYVGTSGGEHTLSTSYDGFRYTVDGSKTITGTVRIFGISK